MEEVLDLTLTLSNFHPALTGILTCIYDRFKGKKHLLQSVFLNDLEQCGYRNDAFPELH